MRGQGDFGPLDLENVIKNRLLFCFEWEKTNSITFGSRLEKFWTIPYYPLGKNSSGTHVVGVTVFHSVNV